MSPMTGQRSFVIVLSLIALSVLFGCSSQNSQTAFNPDKGKHGTSWLPAGHSTAAVSGNAGNVSASSAAPGAACTECHGADLTGGISGVSCTKCHLGGPASIHPADWDPIYGTHGPYANTNGTTACANQYCHGTSLQGASGSGPACTTCHSWPYNAASVTCGACHSIPPSGTASPNIAGRHAQHATSNVASCDVCHKGASAYVGNHVNNTVDLSFATAYNPKSGGTPSYSATANTCSNISCHGAQTTPNWQTGTLDVNTQCTSCHAYGTTQYNSFHGIRHDLHVNSRSILCGECHDTTKLSAVHFNDLDTSAMTEAWDTLLASLNYTGTGSGAGNCTVDCHGKNHATLNWVY